MSDCDCESRVSDCDYVSDGDHESRVSEGDHVNDGDHVSHVNDGDHDHSHESHSSLQCYYHHSAQVPLHDYTHS